MGQITNKKRAQRIRKKLKNVNKDRLRLSIHRSLKNISAQIIDDKNHKTLVSEFNKNLTEQKYEEITSSQREITDALCF